MNAGTRGRQVRGRRRAAGRATAAVSVPVMFGWTSHQNVYAPAGSAGTSYVTFVPRDDLALEHGRAGGVLDGDVVRRRVLVVEDDVGRACRP